MNIAKTVFLGMIVLIVGFLIYKSIKCETCDTSLAVDEHKLSYRTKIGNSHIEIKEKIPEFKIPGLSYHSH
jgi:hypothetical protein